MLNIKKYLLRGLVVAGGIYAKRLIINMLRQCCQRHVIADLLILIAWVCYNLYVKCWDRCLLLLHVQLLLLRLLLLLLLWLLLLTTSKTKSEIRLLLLWMVWFTVSITALFAFSILSSTSSLISSLFLSNIRVT